MKKLVTLVLILVTASLGVPVTGYAQTTTAAQLGTISGETVDAGGRALANQRVELLRDNQVLNSTTTGSRGEWSFTNVAPGEYVVRTMVNGQVAGVKVTVTPGQMIARALIVTPSAAAPSARFAPPMWVWIVGIGFVALGVGLVVKNKS